MILFLTCLTMGLAIAVGQNIPEIRDTIHDRHGHPYVGTACYLVTTSIGYALILWLVAVALFGLAELTQQK